MSIHIYPWAQIIFDYFDAFSFKSFFKNMYLVRGSKEEIHII